MPALLAAQGETSRTQLFQNIAVTYGSGPHGDTRLAHRDMQPEIAHDRRHQCVVGQDAGFLHPDRQHRHDGVPIDDRTGSVNGQASVRVTVVRDTEIGTVLDDSLL